MGNAYLSLGEYQKAIQYYEKGLELSTAIGDQSGIASNNGNFGSAYLNLGEYQKAIQYYEKGLELSTAIGDQSGIANNNGISAMPIVIWENIKKQFSIMKKVYN